MAARVVQEWGRVECWSRMRAAVEASPWTPLDPALLQLVTEMNLFGTVYGCNAVAPIMKQQRSGKIVTVSSVAGPHHPPMAVMPIRDRESGNRPLHAVSGARSRAVRDHRELHRPWRDRDRADHSDRHSGEHANAFCQGI